MMLIRDAAGNEHPLEMSAIAISKVYGLGVQKVVPLINELMSDPENRGKNINDLVELMVMNQQHSHVMSIRHIKAAQKLRRFFFGEESNRYVCVNPHTGESEIGYDTLGISSKMLGWIKKYGEKEVVCWMVFV